MTRNAQIDERQVKGLSAQQLNLTLECRLLLKKMMIAAPATEKGKTFQIWGKALSGQG